MARRQRTTPEERWRQGGTRQERKVSEFYRNDMAKQLKRANPYVSGPGNTGDGVVGPTRPFIDRNASRRSTGGAPKGTRIPVARPRIKGTPARKMRGTV